MITADEQAQVLTQALPYIRAFVGKTLVIKYGGNAMINGDLKRAVMRDLVLMRLVGINPILVHGGGPEIDAMVARVGLETKRVNGLRVTDAATMEIVEMVLAGKTNKSVVADLCAEGAQAVGLCGKDANLFVCQQDMKNGDIGFVGEIVGVNTQIIDTLTQSGYIPVISPIGGGSNGESYNINADTAASALAIALKAEKLILMTDVEGLYKDFSNKDTLISQLTASEAREMIKNKEVDKGMIPKLDACATAVEDGVSRAHILDGRRPHALLIEIFTESGIGTMVW
jgi:acetylglutamate kinase